MARRGGRKLIVTPDGSDAMPRARIDSALVEATLDGRQGEAVTLEALIGGAPVGWVEREGNKGVDARSRQPAIFRDDAACPLNDPTSLIDAPDDR